MLEIANIFAVFMTVIGIIVFFIGVLENEGVAVIVGLAIVVAVLAGFCAGNEYCKDQFLKGNLKIKMESVKNVIVIATKDEVEKAKAEDK